jgi:hypothetical protein
LAATGFAVHWHDYSNFAICILDDFILKVASHQMNPQFIPNEVYYFCRVAQENNKTKVV